MFPWFDRWLSPNESDVGDLEALAAGESSEAPSPAPEQEQETPEKPVPYGRFKEVNDKLADALAKLEAAAKPSDAKPAPSLDPKMLKSLLAESLKEAGVSDALDFARRAAVERKRDQILGELRQFKEFDEARDLPKIIEFAKAKKVGAVDAFKLMLFDKPKQAAVAHDTRGTTTGPDKQQQQRDLSTPVSREKAAKDVFKGLLERDPGFRKALELE